MEYVIVLGRGRGARTGLLNNYLKVHLCSGYMRVDEIKLVGNVMSCCLKSQVEAKSTSS